MIETTLGVDKSALARALLNRTRPIRCCWHWGRRPVSLTPSDAADTKGDRLASRHQMLLTLRATG